MAMKENIHEKDFLLKCVDLLQNKIKEQEASKNETIERLTKENKELKQEVKTVKEQKARLQRVCKKKPSNSGVTTPKSSYKTNPKPLLPK